MFIASFMFFTANSDQHTKDNYFIHEVVKITESQPLNFISIKNKILNDWKKFKQIEKIELSIKNNVTNPNFLNDLENDFQNTIEKLTITSSNAKLPRDLILNIFNSNINTISYTVDEKEIHLSKLLKINIEKNLDRIKNEISLNDEIRSSLYNELLKNTKISTNDQMLNAIVNSY